LCQILFVHTFIKRSSETFCSCFSANPVTELV
jgi:hypothetical protein